MDSSIEYAITGFPLINLIFFLGTPLLPPLAVMMLQIFLIIIFFFKLYKLISTKIINK